MLKLKTQTIKNDPELVGQSAVLLLGVYSVSHLNPGSSHFLALLAQGSNLEFPRTARPLVSEVTSS